MMVVMSRGTRDFAVHARSHEAGNTRPEQERTVQLPIGPSVDYSWHDYASCSEDPDAQVALEIIHNRAASKRPWAPWCDPCPVKGLCLRQGLAEDAAIPSGDKGRHSPMVWGNLTPHERKRMTDLDRQRLKGRVVMEQRRLHRAQRSLARTSAILEVEATSA